MTNEKIVLNCIMELNDCDMVSAIKFVEHNQTCYNIAMAVAQAKDEQLEAEKQALIDKACEWLKENVSKHLYGTYVFNKGLMLEEFETAMKGGEE